MTSKWSIIIFFIAMVAATLHRSTAQTTHVVGDALGWTFPPGGLIFYPAWASNKDFFVGDTLVFNFTNGVHNVAQLTSKSDYESCTTSSASNTITTSPARITLTTPGEHFYVCTFPTHCGVGMRLAVNVSSATTSPPSNSIATPPTSGGGSIAPSISTTTPPTSGGGSITPTGGFALPPSPSSASKVVVAAAIPITLLSIAFTLFY